MNRAFLLLAVVLLLIFTTPVLAADSNEGSGNNLSKPLSRLLFSSEGPFKLEVRATGSTDHLWMHFDVPFHAANPQFGSELALAPAPLDFKPKRLDLFVGGLETDLTYERFGVFLNGEAAIPKTVGVKTTAEPFWAGLKPVEWDGSNLLWYSIEGGLVYHFRPYLSFLGGFRWRHFSMDLENPVDPTGIIQDFHQVFGDLYTSNMRTDFYIPYLGLRVKPFQNRWLRLTFLYSPIAFANVSQSFSYRFSQGLNGVGPYIYEHEHYSMNHFGNFLEGKIEGELTLPPGLGLALWVKADMTQVGGHASQDYLLQTGSGFPPFTINDSASTSDGNLKMTEVSGGLTISF
jgi:hypothetical protein